MNAIALDVISRLNRIQNLPEEADQPILPHGQDEAQVCRCEPLGERLRGANDESLASQVLGDAFRTIGVQVDLRRQCTDRDGVRRAANAQVWGLYCHGGL